MFGPAFVFTNRRSLFGFLQLRTPCVVVPVYMITVPAFACMCLTCGSSQAVVFGRGSGSRLLCEPGSIMRPAYTHTRVGSNRDSQPHAQAARQGQADSRCSSKRVSCCMRTAITSRSAHVAQHPTDVHLFCPRLSIPPLVLLPPAVRKTTMQALPGRTVATDDGIAGRRHMPAIDHPVKPLHHLRHQ